MTDFLERTRQRAERIWQQTSIEDVGGNELSPGVLERAMECAQEIAEAIRIRRPLHSMQPDETGSFSMLAEDLLMVGTDPLDMDFEFEFTHVTDAKAGDELATSLMARRTESDWLIDTWIKESLKRGDCLLVVKDEHGNPGGFLAYSRQINVFIIDEGELELNYGVFPEYLYVSPEARGKKLSSALLRVAMEDVSADLDHLADKLGSDRLKHLPEFSFQAKLSAEAHSLGGLRFLDHFHDLFKDALQDSFEDPRVKHYIHYGVERDYSY